MPSWSERARSHQVPCELCRQDGQQAMRLDPVNWQPHIRRLCRKHREKLGYHLIDYNRGTYAGGKTPGA